MAVIRAGKEEEEIPTSRCAHSNGACLKWAHSGLIELKTTFRNFECNSTAKRLFEKPVNSKEEEQEEEQQKPNFNEGN